jgi:branched-chain amino acid transport system substrate-binding protein
MTSSRRTVVHKRLAAALWVAWAGLALAAAPGESKPISIGISVSLSGPYAAGGKYSLEGTDLWVDQVNRRGGLLGRPVKLVYYDDKSDPNTGVQLYEKLITADKVDLIVGPYSSAVTSAVSTVAEKHKMAMLGPECADVKVYSRGYRYNFQAQAQASRYMLGALNLAKANGYKTLAMLAEDTAMPKAVSSEVADMSGQFGITVVLRETYPKGATDFSALLTKVKEVKPDVVFANSFLPDAQGIFRQARELGVDAKLFAVAIGGAEPEFGNLGATANYVFAATPWGASMRNKNNTEFVKAYQAKFHRAPDYHSAANYAAMEVLEAAVAEVGAIDQDRLAAALGKMELETVYGTYKVDARGIQTGFASALVQWQDGKQVLVWPESVAEGKAILPTPPWSQRK